MDFCHHSMLINLRNDAVFEFSGVLCKGLPSELIVKHLY